MKRYYMEMGAATALYSVLLILSVILLKDQQEMVCLLYTSPSPRDGLLSRMPSSA